MSYVVLGCFVNPLGEVTLIYDKQTQSCRRFRIDQDNKPSVYFAEVERLSALREYKRIVFDLLEKKSEETSYPTPTRNRR